MPHMNYDWWWFGGMHFLWWIFWVILIVLLLTVVLPRQRSTSQTQRETPLEVLQRRYAAGEISTDEYEEKKSRLERDKTKSR